MLDVSRTSNIPPTILLTTHYWLAMRALTVSSLAVSGFLFFAGAGCGGAVPAARVLAEPASSTVRSAPVAAAAVKIPILVYHNIRAIEKNFSADQKTYSVAPAVLEAELKYLKGHDFSPVTMDALADYFSRGASLPPKPAVLTFDDGRETQYQNAFPLLKKYGVRATFYVFTNAIDRPGYLTSAQIKEMSAAGQLFGSHSVFHPRLDKMTDEAAVKKELEKSKNALEGITGLKVRNFAHPFGLYSDLVLKELAATGYETGRALGGDSEIDQQKISTLPARIVLNDLKQFESIVGE